jgi:gluconolactonase
MKMLASTISAISLLVVAQPVVSGFGPTVVVSGFSGTSAFVQRGAATQGAREVTVAAIPGVVAAGSTWVVAWQGTDNADGIVGTADGGLLFAQEQPRRISKLDATDRVSVALSDTHGVGSVAIDASGRVLGVERTCTDPGGRPELCTELTTVSVLTPMRLMLADRFEGKPLGRLNDLVVDRRGTVYFTSGGAYYVGANGTVKSLGENIRANGIMLSRDEKTLYVTNGNTILAFEVLAGGAVANRRTFATLEAGGNGDGMAIDNDGRLYVTSAPGVQIFDVAGKSLGLLPTPRNSISVAFSGPGKKTLYVVGSGALGSDGQEFTTPDGVRNNAKTIYRLPMLAEGFTGRAK